MMLPDFLADVSIDYAAVSYNSHIGDALIDRAAVGVGMRLPI